MIGQLLKRDVFPAQTALMLGISSITLLYILWMRFSKRPEVMRIRRGNSSAHIALMVATASRCLYSSLCFSGVFSSTSTASIVFERALWSCSFAATYVGYGLVAQRVMVLVKKSLHWHKRKKSSNPMNKYPAVVMACIQLPHLVWPFACWVGERCSFSTLVYGWAVYFGLTVLALNIQLFVQVQTFLKIVQGSSNNSRQNAIGSAATQLGLIRALTIFLSVVFLTVVVVGLAADLASVPSKFEIYELMLSVPQCLAVVGMTIIMSPMTKRLHQISTRLSTSSASEHSSKPSKQVS